MSLSEKKH